MIMICPLLAVVMSACNLPETNIPISPNAEAIPLITAPVPLAPVPAPAPVVSAPVKAKNIALVYDGPGACPEDCALAAADTAKQAGFTPKIVGPNALTANSTPEQISALFQDVAIWVQPGGHSAQAYQAISPTLRNALIGFIKEGGGYVGFCAGAFITTQEIGTTGVHGFDIFPGSTAPLGANTGMVAVKWQGKMREIYFEGGPYIYNVDRSSVEVTAYYGDGVTVAAARTQFGKGRVYITGAHPEAPAWWYNNHDPDGSDRDIAAGMMTWAAGL